MDKEMIDMMVKVIPQLGNNAMWLFIIYFILDFLKIFVWGIALACWPYFFYRGIVKAKEVKENGVA